MVREFRWRFGVRSYEGDAWGLVSASNIMRYLEQAAVAAAADGGYGSRFHAEHGTAWVIRRMALAIHTPPRQTDELEIVTWASHFTKVRGGREYKLLDAETGRLLATGLAEWVYMDRKTQTPRVIPPHVAIDFDVPGTPLGTYEPPFVEPTADQRVFTIERIAEWHEADSMAHVNNAVYVDWLDDAVRSAMEEMGWNVQALKEQGRHLRGEHYRLDYKKAAIPGDRLIVKTKLGSASGRLHAIQQSVSGAEGTDMLVADSVYGWQSSLGQPAS
jgi:YbgC/YbaW family acyl-CoA thioester hydrolase